MQIIEGRIMSPLLRGTYSFSVNSSASHSLNSDPVEKRHQGSSLNIKVDHDQNLTLNFLSNRTLKSYQC